MENINKELIDEIFEIELENFELCGEGEGTQLAGAIGMAIDRLIEMK
jgi:hypothetical protein